MSEGRGESVQLEAAGDSGGVGRVTAKSDFSIVESKPESWIVAVVTGGDVPDLDSPCDGTILCL